MIQDTRCRMHIENGDRKPETGDGKEIEHSTFDTEQSMFKDILKC